MKQPVLKKEESKNAKVPVLKKEESKNSGNKPVVIDVYKPKIKTKAQLKKEALANANRTECTAASNEEKDAECPVCLILMFDPVKLPCGHIFCQSCLH